MRVPIERQQAIIVEHARQAAYRVLALLHRDMEEIEELALERLSSLGAAEYEDRSFHKTLDELKQETHEELADAIVYQAIYTARERGVLR